MAKRLMALVGVLAVMLLVAAPAFAQTPGERVEATGVLQNAGSDASYTYYDITDEATGTSYLLRSETVELESYVDQRVDISGTLMVDELFGEATSSAYIEVDQVEPAGSPEARVAATFELEVEGEPPAEATFFGYLGNGGEYVPVQLTDPDGDRVYTGSYDRVGRGDSLRTLVVQGTGTRSGAVGIYAGDPIKTIKDFGDVAFEEDETLTATVSFGDGGSGEVVVDVNEDGAVDEADGEEAARVSDSAVEAAKTSGERTLPITGGAVIPLTAGLLLAAGLLPLACRVVR